MSTSRNQAARCADLIRAAGVDPIGTAGSYAGYLLLEWPRPWPRDVSDIAELESVQVALTDTGLRLQALVPVGEEDARRVIRYDRPSGDGFSGYRRTERVVAAEEVVAAAMDLAAGGGGAASGSDTRVTADVLVCAHGKRDVCCGARGTALAMELMNDSGSFASGTSLWQTSHMGGHRFAPTTTILPQGTVWAYLDSHALGRISRREGPLGDLLPRYRGCTGLGSPAVQAVEREAFADIGWPWLEWRRTGAVDDEGRATVVGTAPDGEERRWTADVIVERLMPVPECGFPLDAATKVEAELRIRGVQRD